MGWVLMMLVIWGNQSFTVQVPVATEQLCETAKAKAAYDFVFAPSEAAAALHTDPNDVPRSTSTCLQVQ